MFKCLVGKLILIFCMAMSAISFADYERFSGTVSKVYLYDNGTNTWGIRIVLNDRITEDFCDEWYVKVDENTNKLRDQMFSIALAAKASSSSISLMRRNDSEDISNEGKRVCGVHRIYLD